MLTSKKIKSKSIRNDDGYQDPIKLYLKDVGKAPLLDHKQEIEISQTIESAKQAIIRRLLGIHLTITTMTSWIDASCVNGQDALEVFDIDLDENDNVSASFLSRLNEVKLACTRYKAGDLDEAEKARLVEQFSELPLNPSSISYLMEQVIAFNKQVMSIDGELLRLAESCGIKREDWLARYLTENDLSWITTMTEAPYIKLCRNHGSRLDEIVDQVGEINVLTGMSLQELRETVKDLRVQAKIKEVAIQKMVTSNLRLVVSVAKKYNQNNPATLLDLVQEGNIGLIKAVEKFKWQLGYRFSTYATWWIRQAIIKATTEQGKTIRVPTHVLDSIKKINNAIKSHVHTHGCEPSDDELERLVEMDSAKINRLLQVARDTVSLESPISDDDETSVGSYIEDQNAVNAVEKINTDDVSRVIAEALSTLSSREERVIRLRFGIGTMDEHTLEEIGNRFNVTRERVRQIEARALQRLQTPARLKEFQSVLDS